MSDRRQIVTEDQFPFETSQGKSETVVKHYETILVETKA
jgi:hypothetical protein